MLKVILLFILMFSLSSYGNDKPLEDFLQVPENIRLLNEIDIAKRLIEKNPEIATSILDGIREQVNSLLLESERAGQRLHDLEKQALYDRDLNVFNKSFLFNWLPENFNNKHIEKIYIGMIDLDNFKDINANWGHNGADEILLRLSNKAKQLIEARTREGEGFFGRYGGDEFYFVLLNITKSRAFEIAEELRSSVENDRDLTLNIPKKNKEDVSNGKYIPSNGITLTLGVAGSEDLGSDFKTKSDSLAIVKKYLSLADSMLLYGKGKVGEVGKNVVNIMTSRYSQSFSCHSVFN